jgi:hypothetical protein
MSQTWTNFSADNREVWVINTYNVPEGENPKDYDYEETFRGKKYLVPAGKKKVLHLPFLIAGQFVRGPGPMWQPLPNGTIRDENGDVDKTKMGKPLAIVEMTEDELSEVLGLSKTKIAEARASEEKALSFACVLCDFKGENAKGLKGHVTKKHPDAQALTEMPEASAQRHNY